ncbi:MAG: queuosine precursor transporter [bacterium]|nr:queuosine precursor transporter [bacterium]
MENISIFVGLILIEFLFISIVSRFGKEWLYGSITLNLILIGLLGAKTIPLFGVVMNSGNVFYAGVFYATYLLIELHGKHEAIRSMWKSAVYVLLFLLMTHLVISTTGTAESRVVDEAMHTLLDALPRVAGASIAAFLIAQFVNINLYAYLRKKTGTAKLWLRTAGAVVLGQAVDSIIFFPLAFLGVLASPNLLEITLTGFLAKVLIGFIGIPFLYLSMRLNSK